jgi:hypothetical protein
MERINFYKALIGRCRLPRHQIAAARTAAMAMAAAPMDDIVPTETPEPPLRESFEAAARGRLGDGALFCSALTSGPAVVPADETDGGTAVVGWSAHPASKMSRPANVTLKI